MQLSWHYTQYLRNPIKNKQAQTSARIRLRSCHQIAPLDEADKIASCLRTA